MRPQEWVSMVLLGLEHGWLALAVGAVTGRRVVAISVAGTVAVAGYLLYALAVFVDGIEPWKVLSPFHQAIGDGPLGTGVPATYLWMPMAAMVFIAVALPIFDRRDIAAH